MIFFSIPSVQQLKPQTLFGANDNFGFIQTLIGDNYYVKEIENKATQYFGKDYNGYWGRIITLINFLGLKKLNQNKFQRIPILEMVGEKYDQGENHVAEILFEYLLCQWQFPHPIVTHNRRSEKEKLDLIIENQRLSFPIIKPYQIILAVLRELYKLNPEDAFFNKSEFYWFGYNFYKTTGKNYTLDKCKSIADNILSLRKNGGWDLFEKIKNDQGTNTHLTYPLGFLKNSTILTTESFHFDNSQEFYFGFLPQDGLLNLVESHINASSEYFEFDRTISERNQNLGYEFSEYLYDADRIRKWQQSIPVYKNTKNFIDFEKMDHITNEKLSNEEYIIRQLINRISNLDKEVVTKRRTEQYLLKKYLFQEKEYGNCAICNEDFPVKFLATAHIKKRSECNDEEKRDLNIVMPTCYLGCDKLYEDGYIVVEEGIIKQHQRDKYV